MNKMNKNSLPVFGVGPIYVFSCFLLTIIGLALNYYGVLNQGKIQSLKIVMLIMSFILITIGVVLWIYAVIIQKIGNEIKKGKLLTEGVYSIVRNPIYSAFSIIFTGILLMANNIFLFILPVIFWVYLTILLKYTEEKWLMEKFGDEYADYCKKVNRIIPYFTKK